MDGNQCYRNEKKNRENSFFQYLVRCTFFALLKIPDIFPLFDLCMPLNLYFYFCIKNQKSTFAQNVEKVLLNKSDENEFRVYKKDNKIIFNIK